jgi:MOSC domain-containing protein YiiM
VSSTSGGPSTPITPPATPTVTAVCVGAVRTLDAPDGPVRTGIDKRPVDGAVVVGPEGLAGDGHAEADHGCGDQAVYAYGQPDADHLETVFGRPCPPGSVGENLRVADLDVSDALLGERWRVGDEVLLEVTAPRIPCRTFAVFWDVPDLVARFLDERRPGAYLRVLAGGRVRAGDRVEVVHRPSHGLSVAETMRIVTRDRDEAERLLAADGAAAKLVTWAQERGRA